jgi:hypothetical protein
MMGFSSEPRPAAFLGAAAGIEPEVATAGAKRNERVADAEYHKVGPIALENAP